MSTGSHHPYDTAGHLPGDMSPAEATRKAWGYGEDYEHAWRIVHSALCRVGREWRVGRFINEGTVAVGVLDELAVHARAAAHQAEAAPPPCPGGCGCRWRMDAERSECACGGPCCMPENEHGVQLHPAWGERPDPDDDDQPAAAPGQGREQELAALAEVLDTAENLAARVQRAVGEEGDVFDFASKDRMDQADELSRELLPLAESVLEADAITRLRALADGDQEGQR